MAEILQRVLAACLCEAVYDRMVLSIGCRAGGKFSPPEFLDCVLFEKTVSFAEPGCVVCCPIHSGGEVKVGCKIDLNNVCIVVYTAS